MCQQKHQRAGAGAEQKTFDKTEMLPYHKLRMKRIRIILKQKENNNDTTDITFYVSSDDEFLRFLHGETDNYYNIYQMATVGSYESENYGSKLSLEECVELLKQFIR